MRVSLFLAIIGVLLAILPFFIKIDVKRKIVPCRIAAFALILLSVAFFYFSIEDKAEEVKNEDTPSSSFASQSSNYGSNVAIEGDNNITIFNEAGGNKTDNAYFRLGKEDPKYKLDTHMEWMDMECVESILTGKSALKVYSRAAGWDWVDTSPNLKEDELLDGISLVALFSNRENFDRNIVKFTVRIDNITENLLPDLGIAYPTALSDSVGITFENNGWGATGEMQLSITDVHFFDYQGPAVVDISLKDGVENRWNIPSILPGESGGTRDMSFEDFDIQWKDPNIESVDFLMGVELYAPKLNFRESVNVLMTVTPNSIRAQEPAGMGGDDIRFGIPVDTSQKKVRYEYSVYQCIPANRQVRLPILIYPTKSCSMDIYISFELDDGEVIKVPPFCDVSIRVPFYAHWREYVDGKYIDEELFGEEEYIDGEQFSREDITFPFEVNTSIMPN